MERDLRRPARRDGGAVRFLGEGGQITAATGAGARFHGDRHPWLRTPVGARSDLLRDRRCVVIAALTPAIYRHIGGTRLVLVPGLRPPYLVQISEFYRRGESAQTAPGQGHAAVEPRHDMEGHGIVKEPGIQHPSPSPLYHRPAKATPWASVRVCARAVHSLPFQYRNLVPSSGSWCQPTAGSCPTGTIIAVRGAAVRSGWRPIRRGR